MNSDGDTRDLRRHVDDRLDYNADGRPDELFSIGVERSSPVVVHVAGEVDILTAPELRDALHDAVASDGAALREVVVDLAETSFIDARGLGVIAEASRMISQAGATLILADPSPMVRKLLALTGLQGVLPVLTQGRTERGHWDPTAL